MVALSQKIQHLYPTSRSLEDWRVEDHGTGPYIAYWNFGAQPTQAQLDAVTDANVATRAVSNSHIELVAKLNNGDVNAKLVRALMLIILDELNLHALKLNAILDAVDGAASLAALKTAVAAIPDYPQRTKAQLITALTNKINAGSADI